MNLRDLVGFARAMRKRAYAPYSGYRVGAALLGSDGVVYGGCNVENASYGLTICAERAAFVAAVAAGCREFVALAVATEDRAPPCGACLQVAREFAGTLPVVLAGRSGAPRETSLAELLPVPFVCSRAGRRGLAVRKRR
jgi:cytidine deaminase